jgi:hypothetical protein
LREEYCWLICSERKVLLAGAVDLISVMKFAGDTFQKEIAGDMHAEQ